MNTPTPTPRTDTGITFTGTYTCTHHNDADRTACPVCLVTALTAERDQLRDQLHALTLICGTNDANKFETWIDRANARAERAEAELAAAKERLRSEAMDDYASIKNLQRELATEREKVRLLKFDKDRLDWYNGESYYQFGKSHKCMDSGWWWSCGYQQNNGKSGIQNIRDTIDSAMAHSKSGRNKYNVCKRIEDSIKEDAK